AATAANKAQRELAVVEARQKIHQAKHSAATGKKGKKVDPDKALADAEKALAKAEADSAKPLGTNYTKRPTKSYPAESSGRLLALARWFAEGQKPCSGGVAANHV